MLVCLMIEGQEDVAWDDWTALASACESSGISGLFSSDHYYSVFDGSGRGAFDVWAVLAALAARTTRLRLGTLVSPVTFRQPAVAAKAAVTVDHVSGGRVELGLGAGWNEREHEAYGFPFPQLDERMTMLEEQLEIVHRLWTEEEVSFTGQHYRIERSSGLPKPVQKPHPPILMGGAAKPRAARLAARFADEYNVNFAAPEACRAARARLDEACEREGRDPATLRLSLMTPCVVGADRAEARERARRRLELEGSDEDPEAALGRPSWIAGTVEQAAAKIADYGEAGVERVMLQHLDHTDVEMVGLIGNL
jgi:F420-dependent oxidoreductase-like protein